MARLSKTQRAELNDHKSCGVLALAIRAALAEIDQHRATAAYLKRSGPWYDADSVEKIKKREWICGIGYAIAEVQRGHDEPVILNDVALAAGLSYDDFRKAGLAPYDLKVIRKYLKKRTK